MDAVWMVGERRLASRARFWLTAVGYDPRDRSIGHRIYLFYVLIFFSLWGFTVLLLLTDLGVSILSVFEEINPLEAAVTITLALLLLEFLMRSYRASKRSPFKFTEDDAGLICQTPVSRSRVAFTWMMADWLPGILPYLVLVVVLCFATIQLEDPAGIAWSHLPAYWLAAFRTVSVVVPVQLAITGFVYALGAVRLRQDKEYPGLRWLLPVMALMCALLAYVTPAILQVLFWPVLFPLESGFGSAEWLPGIFVGMILVVISFGLLHFASARMNLSRAAQESRFKGDDQRISWLGDAQINKQVKLREQLGIGHRASRIPGLTGVRAMIWKDWVVSLRADRMNQVVAWMGIVVAGLVMMAAPGWGTRIWGFVFWAVLISMRCTERLRSDLGLWTISRQLPFRAGDAVITEVAQPVFWAICAGWLSFGIAHWLGYGPQSYMIWLIPGIILSIALSAVADILRRCRSSDLLVSQVAEVGSVGMIMIFLLAGLPWFSAAWVADQIISWQIMGLATLVVLALCFGISYLLWRWSATLYRNIK